MTLRLVALMSVVLLLSLAAVGLLVNHYQEQFMREVHTTAADVGQAALRTLNWTSGDGARVGKAVARLHGPDAPHGAFVEELHEVILADIDDGGVPHRRRVRHIVTTSTDDNEFTVREQLIYPPEAFPATLPGEALAEEFKACLSARVGAASTGVMFINVEAVRAESDPLGGLVLMIPRFVQADGQPVAGEAPAGATADVLFHFEPFSGNVDRNVVFARGDEIQLPIGGNYQELFSKLRNRSLFLFMGVFLVGMVLSTGLASRFTRPIRKLDAGIRRLSEGDLDVEVGEQGKGEIGRLSRTFLGIDSGFVTARSG